MLSRPHLHAPYFYWKTEKASLEYRLALRPNVELENVSQSNRYGGVTQLALFFVSEQGAMVFTWPRGYQQPPELNRPVTNTGFTRITGMLLCVDHLYIPNVCGTTSILGNAYLRIHRPGASAVHKIGRSELDKCEATRTRRRGALRLTPPRWL